MDDKPPKKVKAQDLWGIVHLCNRVTEQLNAGYLVDGERLKEAVTAAITFAANIVEVKKDV